MRKDSCWLLGTIVERRGPLSYLVQVANGVVWKRQVDHLQKTVDSPQEEVTVPEIIQLLHHYNLIKIHQLFNRMKEVLLFLLPMIQFLSSQKDPRLQFCQLKSLSLTLLPYLLDVTLNSLQFFQWLVLLQCPGKNYGSSGSKTIGSEATVGYNHTWTHLIWVITVNASVVVAMITTRGVNDTDVGFHALIFHVAKTQTLYITQYMVTSQLAVLLPQQ